ncbi:MAG: cyclase family protein [Actinobacteria bacterium]|nr:cyclase family protein [Actinomycetota bacterium]
MLDRAFLDRLASATVYDLGTRLEMGMPVHPAHCPYVFTLQRRHGDTARPGGYSSANEVIVMSGHTGTHLDALGHISEYGRLNGGRDAADVQQGGRGLKDLGIEQVAPVVRRGVLLDVAGAEGVATLPAGFAITRAIAQAVARAQGVEIRPGDAVLVNTGWMRYWSDPAAFLRTDDGQPGIDAEAAAWLATRRIFLGGSDTVAFEHVQAGSHALPVHPLFLVRNGIHILEMADLRALARDKVYEFGFILAPLKFAGGTASPVRPLALV